MTKSYEILNAIRSGDLFCKPGWIRLSVHPTMTNAEIDFIMDAVELTASHFQEWMADYTYDPGSNEYLFNGMAREQDKTADWFNASLWGNPTALVCSGGAMPGFETIRS